MFFFVVVGSALVGSGALARTFIVWLPLDQVDLEHQQQISKCELPDMLPVTHPDSNFSWFLFGRKERS